MVTLSRLDNIERSCGSWVFDRMVGLCTLDARISLRPDNATVAKAMPAELFPFSAGCQLLFFDLRMTEISTDLESRCRKTSAAAKVSAWNGKADCSASEISTMASRRASLGESCSGAKYPVRVTARRFGLCNLTRMLR